MTLLQQLITWQQEQAKKEHLEPYMVIQFNTIKEIARVQPKTTDELIRIKGIGPAKVRKYGDALLRIVRSDGVSGTHTIDEQSTDLFAEASAVNDLAGKKRSMPSLGVQCDATTGEVIDDDSDALTVTTFVTMLDTALRTHFRCVRIQGEVVGFKRNVSGHAYFEIKDAESILRCAIFRHDYDLSGVHLEDGMEIIVTGHPNYHKKYGFSFIANTLELYGEGALKKAYDDLKKKLTEDGLLALERKRAVPQLPQRIGLITSRTGAAIGDFMSNVGQYGYTIIFHHTSVEGAHAVREIKDALTTMAKKDIDVLVIVRGGGSLESLQAFNNETIVRMITDFPVPVVVGIGHEQDETIATLVADVGASTPTAAARTVRESWDQCTENINRWEDHLLRSFADILGGYRDNVASMERQMITHVDRIIAYANDVFRRFDRVVDRIQNSITQYDAHATLHMQHIVALYERSLRQTALTIRSSSLLQLGKIHIARTADRLHHLHMTLMSHDPQRHLALGYSIATNEKGQIVRSVKDVTKDDMMHVRLSDGTVTTRVEK
jgi:exodeoxyribonuclease VII large subunit